MIFRNFTIHPAAAYQGLTASRVPFHVVALRQTYSFKDGALAFDEAQSPLHATDTFIGSLNQSSLLTESDYCPFKLACDVLVHATAYAPRGRPARHFPVRLRLSARELPSPLLDKELRVSGPSWFRRRGLLMRGVAALLRWGTLGLVRVNPWFRTGCGEILNLPLSYEYAFGGESKILVSQACARRVARRNWLEGTEYRTLARVFATTREDAPLAWTIHSANPVGRGFAQEWFLKATRARAIPAPQIEAPGLPVTARLFSRHARGRGATHPAFIPRGFGPQAKGWLPRRLLAGTAGEPWAASGRPWPDGFSFAFWNTAPPDQQIPHLRGDETLELINLCRPGRPGAQLDDQGQTILRLALPGHAPHLLARCQSGRMFIVPLALDTLQVDVERSSLGMVWRAVLPMEPALRVLEARMSGTEMEQAHG